MHSDLIICTYFNTTERKMERKDWTLLVYRMDKRCNDGKKLHGRYEYCDKTELDMRHEIKDLSAKLYTEDKFCIELHETYVTRVNMMTGLEYEERYDTPRYCSPSSESFWSM